MWHTVVTSGLPTLDASLFSVELILLVVWVATLITQRANCGSVTHVLMNINKIEDSALQCQDTVTVIMTL